MLFLFALSCLVISYAAIQFRFYQKRRRLMRQSWELLVGAIKPLNVKGIAAIAECYLRPSSKQFRVEPDEMWLVVGGFDGLRALKHNANAMLDLAVYAEQWNSVEGRLVSEMMRRDGVRLNRAIRRIELALVRQAATKYAAFELQEAVASYHLMRGRLLGLYEVANGRRHQLLAGTI